MSGGVPIWVEPSQAVRSIEPMHAGGRLGKLGEQFAAAHCERLGFPVLGRNVRVGRGQIDLIAFNRETLVFASR